MKVILLEELEGHGSFGDTITVRDGFANNYLIPRKIAIPATEGNIRYINNILSRKPENLKRLKQKLKN